MNAPTETAGKPARKATGATNGAAMKSLDDYAGMIREQVKALREQVDEKTRALREKYAAEQEEIDALMADVDRLEAAEAALQGKVTTTTRKPSRRGRSGGGGGKRADEALGIVTESPGISIPEMAQKMGIQQNYLYRVLPSLEEAGKVRKDGRGWFPKS